jgi:hypothetical protein
MTTAELLGLDSEQLQVMAEIYEGYANVSPAEFPEIATWVRANRLVIAASFWTAIDATKGAKLFMSAAQLYSKLASVNEERFEQGPAHDSIDIGMEVPLAISGQDTGILRERCFRWIERRDDADPPELIANKLLAFSHLAITLKDQAFFSELSRTREAAMQRPAHRIGRLGIPLALYSALATAVQHTAESRHLLPEFATWLDQEVHSARANGYLWRNLLSAILPINPLGLAFCCVWDRVMSQENLAPEFPINALAYFEAAHRIVQSVQR